MVDGHDGDSFEDRGVVHDGAAVSEGNWGSLDHDGGSMDHGGGNQRGSVNHWGSVNDGSGLDD